MSINSKFKIGIVGCGTIADIHAQAIGKSGNANLISVYSRNEQNARRVGEKYNTKWFTDWEGFISDEELDAVSICTPNGNHLDYCKMVAQAGKHVILEKPIEVTLERGKQLIDTCENHGVRLSVIYQNRFIPAIQQMKQQIDNGDIGRLFMGDAYIKWFRTQEYYDSGAWRGSFALDGGGVLINQGIHTIDLLQWLMGDVESVFGQIGTMTHQRMEGEDNAVATLRFKNGAIGVIEGSTSVQPAQSRRIEIHGTKGSTIIDGDLVNIYIENQKIENNLLDSKGSKSAGASSPLGGFDIKPHTDQFKTIVDAITRGESPPISGKDSLKSLAIVLAIYQSAGTMSVINLDEFQNT